MKRLRPAISELRLAIPVLLLDWAALGIAIAVTPGLSAHTGWDVLLAAVLLAVAAALLRPLFAAFAARLGWAGVVAGWLLTQALLVYLALSAAPNIEVHGFWPAFWGSWVYSALVSAGMWVVTAGDNSAVLAHLLRTTRRDRREALTTTVPGVVIIQIDGLSAPLARWAVQAGNLPALTRWIRSGSHRLAEWHAQLPATTPASQAGLLHGASAHVPAFRWLEKETGRLVVTNHPRDAEYVERGFSDGRGLLADGGVSLSNVFSGDAPVSLLTMSTVARKGARRGPTREVSTYLVDPFGLTRSLVLTIGEMIKEVFQARRQRARDIEPRVHRSASYVALRGVTNVLLRDLNLTLIAEHMMRGAPVIYCDFVDYDEIAHHAGPTRAESLASLDGIDWVLGTLEQVAADTPRPYHFVVLSDHGQSQGATFLQRHGLTLEALVRRLMSGEDADVAGAPENEQWGRVRALLTELSGERQVVGRLTSSVLEAHHEPAAPAPAEGVDLVVVASGNLGMVYLARERRRLTMEEIETQHPNLLTGLVTHPGIGFVMVRSASRGAVVLGRDGVRHLADGRVDGTDPLAAFGPHAAADLARHDTLPHVGDIVLNSPLDTSTDEVAAFEELVGCHGGLGGWQTRPVLIHPAAWPAPDEIIGADAVHRQLVRWLEDLGLRTRPGPPGPGATGSA
ncbi:phage holin family protein [Catellatospora bangladeshensis]|uniref:Membrane protein n=1 Tax=Catellatospora bangladeshensis TaxID=310355 RepID=A0A8J3JIV1_9ACTN|nr:phage holin family protein [Catellatospora bangladeshensis]GIF81466.1 membrane protein [Catellatospora bangladeshensis]